MPPRVPVLFVSCFINAAMLVGYHMAHTNSLVASKISNLVDAATANTAATVSASAASAASSAAVVAAYDAHTTAKMMVYSEVFERMISEARSAAEDALTKRTLSIPDVPWQTVLFILSLLIFLCRRAYGNEEMIFLGFGLPIPYLFRFVEAVIEAEAAAWSGPYDDDHVWNAALYAAYTLTPPVLAYVCYLIQDVRKYGFISTAADTIWCLLDLRSLRDFLLRGFINQSWLTKLGWLLFCALFRTDSEWWLHVLRSMFDLAPSRPENLALVCVLVVVGPVLASTLQRLEVYSLEVMDAHIRIGGLKPVVRLTEGRVETLEARMNEVRAWQRQADQEREKQQPPKQEQAKQQPPDQDRQRADWEWAKKQQGQDDQWQQQQAADEERAEERKRVREQVEAKLRVDSERLSAEIAEAERIEKENAEKAQMEEQHTEEGAEEQPEEQAEEQVEEHPAEEAPQPEEQQPEEPQTEEQ